eukprot:206480_1
MNFKTFYCIIIAFIYVNSSETVLKDLSSNSAATDSFNDWLFRNEITIPPSLQKKLKDKFIASIDVLHQLKKMGDHTVNEILADLQLNTIETAIFNVILSKLDGNTKSNVCVQSQNQTMNIVPEIVSITDNKNGAINIKWKLKAVPFNTETTNRLKLEWVTEEQEFDFDYTNDRVIETYKFDLETVHETKNIIINNMNANIFRLKWRSFSNTKTIKIESDRWDSVNKGQYIRVDNNIIQHIATNLWSSVYGQVICKHPYTYHWKFKIKSFALYFMFGVARVSNGYRCTNTYLGTIEKGYYAAYQNSNNVQIYNTGNDFVGQYGMQRFNKNGDTLDMYLDLTNYKLSFETGGEYSGVTIENLPQEKYRMIVSLYNKQHIELVAFDYH